MVYTRNNDRWGLSWHTFDVDCLEHVKVYTMMMMMMIWKRAIVYCNYHIHEVAGLQYKIKKLGERIAVNDAITGSND